MIGEWHLTRAIPLTEPDEPTDETQVESFKGRLQEECFA